MASASLNLHAGGHLVSLDELEQYKAPPPEGRWFPLSHSLVYRRVKETLDGAGYKVAHEQLAVHKGGNQFFGIMELKTPVSDGIALAVGVRNSTNKTFPISFCAGQRVFVCSNLAFRAELLVRRKHSRFGERRFSQDIASAVAGLASFKEEESRRIEVMKATAINDTVAESLTVRAWERGILSVRVLADVLAEWRTPSYPQFEERTAWSYFNACTTVLGRGDRPIKQPAQYVAQTMMLHSLLAPADPHIQQAS